MSHMESNFSFSDVYAAIGNKFITVTYSLCLCYCSSILVCLCTLVSALSEIATIIIHTLQNLLVFVWHDLQ